MPAVLWLKKVSIEENAGKYDEALRLLTQALNLLDIAREPDLVYAANHNILQYWSIAKSSKKLRSTFSACGRYSTTPAVR